MIFNFTFLIFNSAEGKPSTGWIIFRKLQSLKPRPLTAVATIRGDLSGVIYNPSVLATLNQKELFTLGELGLVEDRFAGLIYGHPFKLGSALATGIFSYDAGEMTLYWIDKNYHEQEKKMKLQEDLLGLISYGELISDKFSAGLTFKYATSKMVEKLQANAYAVDIGCMWMLINRLTISGAIQNFGSATRYLGRDEKLPLTIWLGAGYVYSFSEGFTIDHLMISGDLPYLIHDSRVTPSIGIEVSKGSLSAFLGYQMNTDDGIFSFGLSLNTKNFDISYSYSPARWFNPIHRIAFGFRFGKVLSVVQKPTKEVFVESKIEESTVKPVKPKVEEVPVKP